ncbi:Retrovirus-related Pol polyprotein from transposon TNT 1-94 [Senna tora]|uniref:Retrovirus-related Pol polyprotein from transposon TNT 1-94 n=1 Tax=Senna tora TaxID=362788 RepID=A0A834XFD6_9FABA|nr:Retrovirus-related Pol polyprotein from transposon TNT 1-94 [Senna tora]
MESFNSSGGVSTLSGVEKLVGTNYKRFIIRGLKQEYTPFVTSIQGWAKQPSIEELENLLSNQEALAKQMSKTFILNETHVNYADFNDEWIIDSGCSHHVTGDDSVFLELRQHDGERVIVTADNSTYPVMKEGVVKIGVDRDTDIKLNDVYHVPGLKKNLVSVSQITNSGKYVLFGPNDVKVLDNLKNVDANVVLSGKKKGSLFVMSAGEAYVKKTSQTDSAAIWHARLGHLGYQMLQQISSKKLLDGLPTLKDVRESVICQGCQYGKSHHLPFKNSSNRKLTPFELIHTDLMGPTKTASYSGKEKSPFELIFDTKPNVSYFRVFGSICYVHVPKANRTKLDPKARKCVFVGYDSCRKGWKCMDPETKKFITSRDVVFYEVSSYAAQTSNVENAALDDNNQDDSLLIPEPNASRSDESVVSRMDSPNTGNVEQNTRRSSRERKQPDYLKDYEVQLNHCTVTSCFFAGESNEEEPTCYEDAKDSSLFVKLELETHLLVLLYVDDMIITGSNEAEISHLRNDLSTRFEMKVLGEVGCFLGLEVEKGDKGYFISQKIYAKNLLQRFGMGESRESPTPMELNHKMKNEEGSPLKDARSFRQLVENIHSDLLGLVASF